MIPQFVVSLSSFVCPCAYAASRHPTSFVRTPCFVIHPFVRPSLVVHAIPIVLSNNWTAQDKFRRRLCLGTSSLNSMLGVRLRKTFDAWTSGSGCRTACSLHIARFNPSDGPTIIHFVVLRISCYSSIDLDRVGYYSFSVNSTTS